MHIPQPTQPQGFFWTGDFDQYFLGHQFEEIYKARIYKPFLENKQNAIVLDIGANLGLFSLYAAKYAQQVYALEPSVEHFANFLKMLDFNQIKNVTPINKALWLENTKLPLFHNKNKTMYSLHQAVMDKSSPNEEVDTMTLDALFEKFKIEHVDLLKADIEGSEIEIFSSASFKKVASKIDVVITERHAWSGRNNHQLDEALKNNGFKVETIANDADIVLAQRIK